MPIDLAEVGASVRGRTVHIGLYRRDRIVAFRRDADGESLVVLLNFSDSAADAVIPWPAAGMWAEQIDGTATRQVDTDGQWLPVRVPSHYGAVHLRT